MWMSKLAACLLNVSEGCCFATLEKIANAAASKPPVSVLNIFADRDYNRSVLTIAAPLNNIAACVMSAAVQAFDLIRVDQQEGVHPRLGSVDLVPLYPLTPDVSVDECAVVAQEFGRRLTERVPGSSVFFFGAADPQSRGLVARRKDVRWFDNQAGRRPDLGEFSAARGLTGVGASHYVTNFNISLATTDVGIGRAVADRIRGSAVDGVPGIQSMAFPHEGSVEVACNVESCSPSVFRAGTPTVAGLQGQCYACPDFLERRIAELASERGVAVCGRRVVGFVPADAARLAASALQTDDRHVWRSRQALGQM